MIRNKVLRSAAMVALVAIIATVASPALAVAGTVKLAGSTTVYPLAQQWASAYHKANPGTSFSVNGGGSGAGFTAAAAGTAIGMSSRDSLSSDTKSAAGGAPVMVPVARDAVAVVVNPANPVKNLTPAQVKAIYTGQITTWKQLGVKSTKKFNAKKPIVLAGRTGASGTYEFFKERFLDNTRQSKRTKQYASNGMVRSKVSSDKYAIGYVSIAFVNKKVRGVKVSGVAPTKANANSGAYPYVRPLYFVYYPNYPWTGEASAFVNWVKSSAGQAIANKEYLPLN